MYFAHIAGIPVEETILWIVPLWGVLIIQLKSFFKKKCCDCGERCCCCSDD